MEFIVPNLKKFYFYDKQKCVFLGTILNTVIFFSDEMGEFALSFAFRLKNSGRISSDSGEVHQMFSQYLADL
jgi:hypothetical protein